MTSEIPKGRPGSRGNIFKHGWRPAEPSQPSVHPDLATMTPRQLKRYMAMLAGLANGNDLSAEMRANVEHTMAEFNQALETAGVAVEPTGPAGPDEVQVFTNEGGAPNAVA